MDRHDAPADWAGRIRAGNRRAIARAITVVENDLAGARVLLEQLAGDGDGNGHSRVIGVTGPPGAGKSTLVNAIAKELLRRGRSVAIVAVDPSSPITGGAVLGDRVRMGDVQADDRIFIRSLAARGHLGGLTRATRGVVAVLDAARFDDIIVETVGAGQSEVEIATVAPTRIVVCPPGLGDDVQAMKAGILEIADILVVNKSDLPDADRTERELRAMLALRRVENRPPVLRTIATSATGVTELVDAVTAHANTGARTMPPLPQGLQHNLPVDDAQPAFLAKRTGAPDANADANKDSEDARHAAPGSCARLELLAARDPYLAHLGLEFVDGGEGHATLRMRVRRHHLNFLGGCHGGAIFSLADAALGLACNSYGTIAALVDAHIAIPAAVKDGDTLTARAFEVSRSRKLATYRTDVKNADGTLVASLTGTVYLVGRALPGVK